MAFQPKVIIDTDAGLDDAVGIFMALAAHKRKDIEVVGITTVQGNTSVDNVNRNVLRILDTVNLLNIPVFSGCKSALVHSFDSSSYNFHGSDGFGDAIFKKDAPPVSLIQEEHAVNALTRLANKYKGEIYLAAIAPLTNIALALRLDPSFASNLSGLYIMGGNITGEGNSTVSAEYNFLADPESAFVTLNESKCIVKVVPWEPCLYDVYISYGARRILGNKNNAICELMNLAEEKILNDVEFNHWVNCDQLCIAWLLDDLLQLHSKTIKEERKSLVTQSSLVYGEVELTGNLTRGQLVIHKGKYMKRNPNVCCLEKIDQNIFGEYLDLAFTGE